MPEIALSVSATYVDLCQFIQYELGLLGIPLKLDIQQAAQQKEMMRSYKLPFYRASWIADYPNSENYLALFYSKNLQPFGSNNTHFVNAEYDRLYEKTTQEIQDSIRQRNYVRLSEILLEEAPVCVLYYDQVVRFVQKNIKNLGINPTNQLQLEKVIKL
jgi:peptide/nickel transport system substrate-binding protein